MKDPARPYVQRRRAEAAAATGARILAAVSELFLTSGDEPTLEAVAERAGVTVQTILRRFGSKQGLIEAALAEGLSRVADERGAAPVGNVAGAITNLMDHYAAWGERSLRLLAMEGQSPTAAAAVRDGRALHRAWVERVFAPFLDGVDDRPRRVLQLIAATDVYVWKLLSLDLGLADAEVEATVADLVRRIVA